MDNLLTIAFEAHNAELNHHRRYRIMVGRDLFDHWTVSICYGRAGQRGHELRYGGSHAGELQAIVRERLRRRLSARRRIGCPYRVTVLNTTFGFDASHWLPRELIADFFAE